MSPNTAKNKLIVILSLSGSYKGGAERRYLTLFNYLQEINRNDYFLLVNDTLYAECLKDHILTVSENLLCVPIKYGKKMHPKSESDFLTRNKNPVSVPKQRSRFYNFLGSLSSFLKQFRGWIGYSLKLMKLIKKNNIGVIYGVFTGGIWSWQIARFLNIRFIYSYNDSSASTIESKILRILQSEYYTLKIARKIDFLSEGVLNKLQEKGINVNEDRVLITPNSFISYDNFYPEYPKINRVVFSARLTFIKNPFILLDAISVLKRKGITDYEMIFLGDGILLNELIYKKDQLKLNNVFFEGGVPDTAKYLKKSRIFLSIQKDNNYPSQSLLEAMACENAIIASDVGETKKLVTEDEGILVPLNAEKIADAVEFLLANPAECNRLGKNARRKVLKEHTIEKFAEYFFAITDS